MWPSQHLDVRNQGGSVEEGLAKIKLLTCLHQRADPELFLIMMDGRTIKQTPCLERILGVTPDLKLKSYIG